MFLILNHFSCERNQQNLLTTLFFRRHPITRSYQYHNLKKLSWSQLSSSHSVCDVFISFAIARLWKKKCVDPRDINLDFHDTRSFFSCAVDGRVYMDVVKCLRHSAPPLADEIMSNWISSASTLLNENISDVTSVLGGRRRKIRFFTTFRCTSWCRKKACKKLFTATRGWKERVSELQDTRCGAESRGLRKFVLMFHSSFAVHLSIISFSFRDNFILSGWRDFSRLRWFNDQTREPRLICYRKK